LIQLANPLGAPKGPPLSLREVNPFSEDWAFWPNGLKLQKSSPALQEIR
jgi:hypothetical protein